MKKGGIIGIIIILVIIGIIFLFSRSGNSSSREEIDTFAKCLTEKGVVMYGAFWCPKCAEQKKMFGSSIRYIKEIECDPRGKNEQSALCLQKGVQRYPDWEFADGSRLVGIQQFETLAAKAGCPAPKEQ